MPISAVVPALQEAARIGGLVQRLQQEVDEVIVVDGGSADGTAELAAAAGAQVLQSPRGRGQQLARGLAAARHDLLWMVHADAALPEGAGAALRHLPAEARWGCFEVELMDSRDPRLRFTAAWMNRRALHFGSCTGDMGIWTRRDLYGEVGPMAPLAAFEDLEWSDRARRRCPAWVLPLRLGLSARRWQKEGVGRTILRMWALRAGYRAGLPPERLLEWYRSAPR